MTIKTERKENGRFAFKDHSGIGQSGYWIRGGRMVFFHVLETERAAHEATREKVAALEKEKRDLTIRVLYDGEKFEKDLAAARKEVEQWKRSSQEHETARDLELGAARCTTNRFRAYMGDWQSRYYRLKKDLAAAREWKTCMRCSEKSEIVDTCQKCGKELKADLVAAREEIRELNDISRAANEKVGTLEVDVATAREPETCEGCGHESGLEDPDQFCRYHDSCKRKRTDHYRPKDPPAPEAVAKRNLALPDLKHEVLKDKYKELEAELRAAREDLFAERETKTCFGCVQDKNECSTCKTFQSTYPDKFKAAEIDPPAPEAGEPKYRCPEDGGKAILKCDPDTGIFTYYRCEKCGAQCGLVGVDERPHKSWIEGA